MYWKLQLILFKETLFLCYYNPLIPSLTITKKARSQSFLTTFGGPGKLMETFSRYGKKSMKISTFFW